MEQQRGPKATEDLNIGAPHAIAVAVDKIIEANNIPNLYKMALQIGSRSMLKRTEKLASPGKYQWEILQKERIEFC